MTCQFGYHLVTMKDHSCWRDALKSDENFLVEGQINKYFYKDAGSQNT